jgi:hypothetical protein
MIKEVLMTSGIYQWSFVTKIFHHGHPSHGGDGAPSFGGVRGANLFSLYDKIISTFLYLMHMIFQ